MMREASLGLRPGQKQGQEGSGRGPFFCDYDDTIMSLAEDKDFWLEPSAARKHQDDAVSVVAMLRRLQSEKGEQGGKVAQLESKMADQQKTSDKLNVGKADQDVETDRLQNEMAGRRQEEKDKDIVAPEQDIKAEEGSRTVELRKELEEMKKELEEMKKASAQQSQQVRRVVQAYKAKIRVSQETEIRLLRENNTLLSATLDNKTRSLDAARMDKDACHRQVADLTEKLEMCKQHESYLTNIEIKGYQREVDRLSLECREYRRQLTKMTMAKRDLLKDLQGFLDEMTVAVMKHIDYIQEGDALMEILEVLINKFKQ